MRLTKNLSEGNIYKNDIIQQMTSIGLFCILIIVSAIVTFVFFSRIKQIAKAGEKIHAKKVKT